MEMGPGETPRGGAQKGKARLRCSPRGVGRLVLPAPSLRFPVAKDPSWVGGWGTAPWTPSKAAGSPQALKVSRGCRRAGSPQIQPLHPKDLRAMHVGERRPGLSVAASLPIAKPPGTVPVGTLGQLRASPACPSRRRAWSSGGASLLRAETTAAPSSQFASN